MSWQNKINMRKNISLAKKKKMMSWIKALEQLSVCRVLEDIHSRYNNILTNNRILEFGILELIVFQSSVSNPLAWFTYVCAHMHICVLYIYIYIYMIYWMQSYFLYSVYSLIHSIFPIWWAFRLFLVVFVLFMPL